MTDTTPPANLTPAEVAEWDNTLGWGGMVISTDTVRARLREISELRGALREILAIDKKAEVGPETDYEFGWNEALIRCQEIAEEATNAKT